MATQTLPKNSISEQGLKLLQGPNLAHLATMGPDNCPHVTPVWIDVEGDDIVINSAEGRQKVRNLRTNPQCSISLVDPEDPYNVLAIQGRVVEITEEGADEHIDRLAKKYLGTDSYPFRAAGEKRLKIRIRPADLLMEPKKAA
jgi:PPOX class probable F420-dependent enzyme